MIATIQIVVEMGSEAHNKLMPTIRLLNKMAEERTDGFDQWQWEQHPTMDEMVKANLARMVEVCAHCGATLPISPAPEHTCEGSAPAECGHDFARYGSKGIIEQCVLCSELRDIK
jgi:hypothetical protein